MDDLERVGAPSFDEAEFRRVMGHFCTGVTIVCAMGDDGPAGLTVQSFTSLSLAPPLVSVAVARTSSSWPRIRAAGVFVVNILGEAQEALCRRFASKGADKFEGVGWKPSAGGAPVLDGALAWVECRLEAEHDAGDHLIGVARVTDMGAGDEGGPLLFYRGGFGRFVP